MNAYTFRDRNLNKQHGRLSAVSHLNSLSLGAALSMQCNTICFLSSLPSIVSYVLEIFFCL